MPARTLVQFKETKTEVESRTRIKAKVEMDGRRFNQATTRENVQDMLVHNLPASNSGRTLGEILCLSLPENLYSIEAVNYAWNRLEVTYSRPLDDITVHTSIAFFSPCH